MIKNFFKNLFKNLKRQTMAFLVVVAIAGVLLAMVGAELYSLGYNVFWPNLSATLGAAIIGGAFGQFIARVFEPPPINEIYNLMSAAKNCPLITDDEKVRPYRRQYHGYLLSHAMGKRQWKYRVFDFARDRRPGYLYASVDSSVSTETNRNKSHAGPPRAAGDKFDEGTDDETRNGHRVYLYDGYLCDPHHLLLVGRLAEEIGTEPDVIHVFPFGLHVQENVMAGLAFLETPDKQHIVTPTMLSNVPLTSEGKFGPVKSPKEEAKLTKLWQQTFRGDVKFDVPIAGL